MKLANTNIGNMKQCRMVILLGTLAAALATAACSSNSKPKYSSPQPQGASVKPAALQLPSSDYSETSSSVESKSVSAVKRPSSKYLTFRSRNYGVSFEYPWQYAYASAKTVATDDSLRPEPDGHEGQLTLVRIDVPKGFYPDTDLESGYFTLGVNPELEQEDCDALMAGKESKSATVNGVDFQYVDVETGGDGSASKVRKYKSFTNGMCYEIELGVKTKNDSGLLREVNPDQVMARLESMLNTVKIAQTAQKISEPELRSSAESQLLDNK